jgi:hypothetical protein
MDFEQFSKILEQTKIGRSLAASTENAKALEFKL